MKKIAAFLLSAVCFASLMAGTAACNPGKGENELVIGITYYAPMNYFDENGKLVGFDTEFAEKACAELGYTPVFKEIDWEKKQIALTTKEIDLIWNGMTIKEELKEYMSITDPYMENKQVVVVRAEEKDRYTDIASLSQATSIAVESGSAGETVTKDLGVEINGLGKQADCLLEGKSGVSDVAVIDITMAKAMTGEGTSYADLTYIDVGFEGETYGIGVRKEDAELLAALNRLIAQYETDGTFDALVKKYMG